MPYETLLALASLESLFLLYVTHDNNLKNEAVVTIRQRFYKYLMLLAMFAILFEIIEPIAFERGMSTLLFISWKSHWIFTSCFFFATYYYERMLLHDDIPDRLIDVFWNSKKFEEKNLYSIIAVIILIICLLFVNPPNFNSYFEFTPLSELWYLGLASVYIIVFRTKLYYKHIKLNDLPMRKKVSFMFTYIALVITCLFQIMLPYLALFGIGMLLVLLLLYYLNENVAINLVNDLMIVKANIEKSSNAKLDFLFNMSHDIRSPMNAIVELSRSLQSIDDFNPNDVKDDIKNIKYSCNNLVNIVNNILDVNKISTGSEDLQLKEYNMNELLADLPNVIRTRIGEKPITLDFEIDQNIASKLYGDTTKLYRVIMNILTNSVKYTEVGKIRMIMKGNIINGVQYLSIKIADTGYGIKKDDFDKMFTKFNRLNDATENSIEGTGLGLVITKKYVDGMGGKIWFESVYNGGTIFYIELPQKIIDPKPLKDVMLVEKNDSIQLVDLTGIRALIVDDDELNIRITKKLLEKYNISVDSCDLGQSCINKMKSGEHYDIILLDDILSDISGVEVVQTIKMLTDYYIPPVVAYTANVMNGMSEKYKADGFDEYLPKPLDVHQLDLIIKKYCKK